MEKEEIIKLLKEKYSDDFTLNLLTQFVIDFQNSFNKYLPTEVVIERLKERIDKIEIIDELINGRLDGRYEDNKNSILLYRETIKNTEYCKYLVFHELIHAITTKDLPNGERMMGFQILKQNRGASITEAMTEYLTKIRNKNLDQDFLSGYDEIVEQMIHIIKIIGEEEVFNSFFYNPEDIMKIFEEHNFDFDEVNEVFGSLYRKEVEIWNLGNEKKLEDLNNCQLFKQAEKLYDIFSKAIGKVDSNQKFKFKYSVLNKYLNEDINLNKIMELYFYSHMFDDLQEAVQNGGNIEELNQILSEVNTSYNMLKFYNLFRNIFQNDKNESAKQLYFIFVNDNNAYNTLMLKNYFSVFFKYAETNLLPIENSFYDLEKIAMIGKFLQDHAEYEFDEVATMKIDTSNNCGIYCFTTSDNKKYMYNLLNYPVERISESDFRIVFPDGELELKIDDTVHFNSSTKSKDPITISITYNEESQLTYLERCLENDEFAPEIKEQYKEKIAKIKARIEERRSKSMQGEEL